MGDVLHDVAPDQPLSGVCLHQTLAEFGGDDFGNMLMFGDRLNLFLGQLAQVQTFLLGQHGATPLWW
ncbi:MAG: hypothetical protein EKK65_03605 [Lysobacterales bacterium]|nr:MAG: hypothetical protein EKK65_03605 [Xanthomonadales bacterium]